MKPVFLSILAAFFWGMAPVLEKVGLKNIPPLAGVFTRSLISVFLCFLIFTTLPEPGWKWMMAEEAKKGILLLLLSGISSALIGQFFYFSALRMGETSIVVGIASTYPLVAFALSLIFLNESFTLLKLLGIILIVSGILLLASGR